MLSVVISCVTVFWPLSDIRHLPLGQRTHLRSRKSFIRTYSHPCRTRAAPVISCMKQLESESARLTRSLLNKQVETIVETPVILRGYMIEAAP